jgi:hypothetical protein
MTAKNILRYLLLGAVFVPSALFPSPCRGENAQAPETSVTLRDQEGISVTVYNEDLALVRDRRRVLLRKGDNRLAWEEVSSKMQPETALLSIQGNPPGFNVIEQNFDFDLLTPQKLLEKYIGRTVQVVKTNPATGVESSEKAKVLATSEGVVLKIGDRIETGMPGRLVYPEIPPDLRDRPTLVLLVQSSAEGPRYLELNYLTTGLSWRADYTAELIPEENRINLSAWASLTNRSGIDYRSAEVQLVAGKVNRVAPQQPRPVMYEAALAKSAPPMAEENIFEYHLYTLVRPLSLQDNQSKQVALMEAADIPVVREYLLRGADYYYRNSSQNLGGNTAIGVFLEFRNDSKAGLGQPLPAGVFRVYQKEPEGNARFVGEDRLEHTPKGGKVRVRLGEAFDVTAERRQTEFKKLAGTGRFNYVFESAYRIVLKNSKKEPVTVKVEEPIPGDWEMIDENHPHEKKAANLAAWPLDVPAEGESVLNYRVRVKF